jgi:hypothetical protein
MPGRCSSRQSAENPRHVGLMGEAELGRDTCQGSLGVREQVDGPVDAAAQQVLVHGHPGGELELGGERPARKSDERGQVVDGQSVGDVPSMWSRTSWRVAPVSRVARVRAPALRAWWSSVAIGSVSAASSGAEV